MIDVYAFADRILCDGLKNTAVDMVQQQCQYAPISVSNVTKAIRLGLDSCIMLQYVIKQLAFEMCSGEENYISYTSAEGWSDMVVANGKATKMLMEEQKYWQGKNAERYSRENPAKGSSCQWHFHPTEESKIWCVHWKQREHGAVRRRAWRLDMVQEAKTAARVNST